MKVTTYSELRKNLAKHMDAVNADHEPVIVTRAGGEACVLMSLDDFNAYAETDYLLATPANAENLRQSITQLNTGKKKSFDLPEALDKESEA